LRTSVSINDSGNVAFYAAPQFGDQEFYLSSNGSLEFIDETRGAIPYAGPAIKNDNRVVYQAFNPDDGEEQKIYTRVAGGDRIAIASDRDENGLRSSTGSAWHSINGGGMVAFSGKLDPLSRRSVRRSSRGAVVV